MRDWFESLEAREKVFVSVGAIVVAIAILWGLIWAPLNSRHNNLRDSVATWEQALAELRPLAAIPQPAAGRPGATRVSTSQSPVVIVDATLGSRGLGKPKRQQPTPNGIRVEFENVAFDDLVLWLGDLSAQHALDVQAGSFTIAASTGPGRVNATLTLERSL